MTEQWKSVIDFEDFYEISNYGRLKSKDRYTSNGRHVKSKIKKLTPDKDGYYIVTLSKNGKHKTFRVSRLVGLHFVSGFKVGYQINHIDEIKTNNRVENLEWVSSKDNINHGNRTIKASKAESRPVVAISKNGLARPFSSLTEASKRLGVSLGNISTVIHGGREYAGSYKFYKQTWEVN